MCPGGDGLCVACGVNCTPQREYGWNFLSRAVETDSVASPFYFLFVWNIMAIPRLCYRINVLLPDPQAPLLACDLKNSVRCRSIDFKYPY
jgi:hypothetical protein